MRRGLPGGIAGELAFGVELGQFALMELNLPKSLRDRLSPSEGALHLAIGLFVTEVATLGQAAETAGLTQTEFLRELGKRRIPIHYGRDELNADLEAVEALAGR